MGILPLDALRVSPNAILVDWVPHASVVPWADVVITHGGMGTVMEALSHGVPLVCIPMGRDQYGNADRISTLGAGKTLEASSAPDVVRATVTDVLSSPSYRAAARNLADLISAYGKWRSGCCRARSALTLTPA